MSQYKYIYPVADVSGVSKGQAYVNVHFLIGYNQGYVEDFTKMAKEMKKAFPTLNPKKVHCSHVVKSSYCDGFTLARWSGCIKFTAKAKRMLEQMGWAIRPDGRCEYHWV